MKRFEVIALVFFLLYCMLTGCMKEDPILQQSPEAALILDQVGSDDSHFYFLPSCDLQIISIRETYQAEANFTCDTIWVDIVCMDGDDKAHTIVYVAPNDPGCPVYKAGVPVYD